MSLRAKWLLTSICGGVLATAAIFFVSDPSLLSVADGTPFADRVLHAVFWPVTVCLHISGPGASLGIDTEGKQHYEATPVQLVATSLGFGFSWVFYSSLPYLIVWFWRKRQREAERFSSAR
jgi:hypothetical protein